MDANVLKKLYGASTEVKSSVENINSTLDKIYKLQKDENKREANEENKKDRERHREQQEAKRKAGDSKGLFDKMRGEEKKKDQKTVGQMLFETVKKLGGAFMGILGSLGSIVGGALSAAIGGLGLGGMLVAAVPILVPALKAAIVAAAVWYGKRKATEAVDSVKARGAAGVGKTKDGVGYNFQDIAALRSEFTRFQHEQFGPVLSGQAQQIRKLFNLSEQALEESGAAALRAQKVQEEVDLYQSGDKTMPIPEEVAERLAKAQKEQQEFREKSAEYLAQTQTTSVDLVRTQIRHGRRTLDNLPEGHDRKSYSGVQRNWGSRFNVFTNPNTDYGDTPQKKQRGGMIQTLLEPGEKVFMPGHWEGIGIQALNDLIPRFQAGGVVEHLHGDPSRAGYEPHGHGTEVNAHDHFAFSSPAIRKAVQERLASGQTPSGRSYQIGSTTSGQHADTSYHYSGQAFDIPWSQFGSGAIGQKDFQQSQQLEADVKGILKELGENPDFGGSRSGSGGGTHGDSRSGGQQNGNMTQGGGLSLQNLGGIGGFIQGFAQGVSESIGGGLGDLAKLVMGTTAGATGAAAGVVETFMQSMFGGGSGGGSGGGGGDGGAGYGHVQTSGAYSRDALIQAMDSHGITDPKERAMFLAQMHLESDGFNAREEYSGGHDYYGGGKRYKGRGYIQLTHDYNYKKYGDLIGVDLVNNPDLAADPQNAAKIALAYWDNRVNKEAARSGDVSTVTRNIQGGQRHLKERTQLYNQYLQQGLQTGGVVNISGGSNQTRARLQAAQEQFAERIAAATSSEPVIIYEDEGVGGTMVQEPSPYTTLPDLPDGPSTVQAAEYFFNVSLGGEL